MDIQHFLSNPFLFGGLLAAIGTTVLGFGKQLPKRLYQTLKNKAIITVEVQAGDRLFYYMSKWFDQTDYIKKCRNLTAICVSRDGKLGEEGEAAPSHLPNKRGKQIKRRILFSPAPGSHILKFNGVLCWVTRVRNEKQSNVSDTTSYREEYKITFFTRNKQIIHEYFDEVVAVAEAQLTGVISIFSRSWGDWSLQSIREPRATASVILPNGDMSAITVDIDKFIAERAWYEPMGIPYKRGYLLYGPPGTGKSSLAIALAGKYQRDIYLLNLADPDIQDSNLSRSLESVESDSIILIEDIDAVFNGREPVNKESKLSFSGVLNTLDGVASKDGVIVIITTNHIDKLDPALLRPGRVDFRMVFDMASIEQVNELYIRFFPGSKNAICFSDAIGDRRHPMATLQEYLMKYRDSEDEAMAHLTELSS